MGQSYGFVRHYYSHTRVHAKTFIIEQECLIIPAIFCQGNRFNALIQTLSGRNYALEFNDSLAATNWTALSTNAGNGALRVLSDPSATPSQRFYRMRQW